MSPAKKKALKIKHPFLRGLPQQYRDLLAKLSKSVSFPRGETVFRDGGKAEQFYLLLKGKINLMGVEQDVRFETEPEKRVFHVLGQGDVVGWSWAMTPYRWRFDAVAAQDVELLSIDGLRLRKMMKKDHELGYVILNKLVPIMNQRLIASRLKLQMFGSKPFSSAEGG